MKKSLFVLPAVLLLSGCSFGYYTYSSSALYHPLSEFNINEFDATKTTALDLAWVNGNVTIKSGEAFAINEICEKEGFPELYYRFNDASFVVKHCKSGTTNSKINKYHKKVEVTIPSTFTDLKLKVISADLTIDVSTLKNITIDSVSGDGEINVSYVEKIDIDSISGGFEINATTGVDNIDIDTTSGSMMVNTKSLKKLNMKSTSGGLKLDLENSSNLESVYFHTTSGDAQLLFDGVKGYNLTFKTVSGDKTLDFTDGSDTSLEKFKLEFKSVSGDLKVKKRA